MINTSINAPSPKGQKEEMKQSLLQPKNNNDSTQAPAPAAPAKKEEKEKKKDYSLWDFMKFTFPYLWRGGFWIRVQTILTFFLLFISRGLNVSHPLILKFAVDDITCNSEKGSGGDCPHTAEYTYILVALYAVIRFLADFVNNIREIPFANVSASAEIYIAHLVYSHTQNQSLAYHLSRETGKVVRIVSRGS